ncbi:MAG: MCE family protein [Gemmataceae bacterium]|nr:MCE family protein [Gemmataceae bacterium]
MRNPEMKIQIGLVVIGSLLLLGTMVIMFGSIPGFFKPTNSYQVSFNDAPGISSGAPVRRSGVRIGQVVSIHLDDATGLVLINIAIERNYKIRKYEQPTLVTGFLGSDSSIDLVPKKEEGKEADRQEIPLGSTVKGVRAPNVASLLTTASDIVPTTQETLNEMRKSMERLEKLGPKVEEALNEFTTLAKKGQEVVPEVKKTLEEYSALARQYQRVGERLDNLVQTNQDKVVKIIDQAAEDLNRLGNLLNEENQKQVSAAIRNLRKGTENLDQLAKNTDDTMKEMKLLAQKFSESFKQVEEFMADSRKFIKPFADRGPSIAKNLDEFLDKSAYAVADLRELIRVIGQADGSFKRFLTDPSLYNNLDAAFISAAKLMPRMDRILRDFETFADKLARHPEALGLGGVVRPGSGLKDNPMAPFPVVPRQ